MVHTVDRSVLSVHPSASSAPSVDRAVSFGGPGGPVCSEVKAALYNEEKKPKVVGIIGGLGGRDVTVADFKDIINQGIEISSKGSDTEFEMYGVRE